MSKLIYYMMYRILGILPGVLAVVFAAAQKPLQHIEIDQCETIEFSVEQMRADRYTWELYTDGTVNFAIEKGDVDPALYFENGMYQGNTVRVHNLPHGRYYLRVMAWDEVNCTNNLILFSIDVNPALPEAYLESDPFCYGDVNEVRIILTGRGPWEVIYTWDNEANQQVVNLNGEPEEIQFIRIPFLDPGKYSFWVMEVRDQCTVNSYEIPLETEVTIHPQPRTTRIYVKPEEE